MNRLHLGVSGSSQMEIKCLWTEEVVQKMLQVATGNVFYTSSEERTMPFKVMQDGSYVTNLLN